MRELRDGAIELVSVDSEGGAVLGENGAPALSPDGTARRLRERGPRATGRAPRQVMVHDRATRETTTLSVSPLGEPGSGASSGASFSGDGHLVVFGSEAVTPDGQNLAFSSFQANLLPRDDRICDDGSGIPSHRTNCSDAFVARKGRPRGRPCGTGTVL